MPSCLPMRRIWAGPGGAREGPAAERVRRTVAAHLKWGRGGGEGMSPSSLPSGPPFPSRRLSRQARGVYLTVDIMSGSRDNLDLPSARRDSKKPRGEVQRRVGRRVLIFLLGSAPLRCLSPCRCRSFSTVAEVIELFIHAETSHFAALTVALLGHSAGLWF